MNHNIFSIFFSPNVHTFSIRLRKKPETMKCNYLPFKFDLKNMMQSKEKKSWIQHKNIKGISSFLQNYFKFLTEKNILNWKIFNVKIYKQAAEICCERLLSSETSMIDHKAWDTEYHLRCWLRSLEEMKNENLVKVNGSIYHQTNNKKNLFLMIRTFV